MTTTPPDPEVEPTVPAEEEKESFGVWLRRQREMREISLREIADTSKISLRYLQALEEERFDLLPAPVFAKGFLRQYARYVGIDPEETVNFYLSADHQENGEALESAPRQPKSIATWSYAAVAVLIALVLMAVVWGFLRLNRNVPEASRPPGGGGAASTSQDGGARPESEAARAPEAPSESSQQEDLQSSPLSVSTRSESTSPFQFPLLVTLDFRGNCWIRASVDGETREDRVYTQGESLQLEARESIDLELGNVFEVDAELNGTPIDLIEGSNQAVRRLRLDPESVAALSQGGER